MVKQKKAKPAAGTKKPLALRLRPDAIAALKKLAEREGRSVANMVEALIFKATK